LTPWDTQQRRVFDAAAGVFPSLDACANTTGGHRGPPSLLITDQRGHDGHGVAPTISAKATNNDFAPMRLRDTVVRRLTPRECERLQGFPDDHTLIPYRGKTATDGHRYKALGNSMAVPVMRWIGERLQQEDARSDQPKSSS
jgi:DNA (cytosine-5)-methyltransferase 1